MHNIYQYSRSEWNNSRDKFVESNLIFRRPSVGYYVANKYAYIHYDTESFGYDVYDLFKKNDEAKQFLKNGIMKVLEKHKCRDWEGTWFYLNIKHVNKSEVKQISEEIYDLLTKFGDRFIFR